jgi:3-(3-hydroxy-phenyl)propionate hydroxylase
LIIGAGPTGLMLAGELVLAGVDVSVVERRLNQDLVGTRAGGFHSRTIEVLDQRGIADRFLAVGRPAQIAGFAWIPVDMSDFPTRYPYGLALGQAEIERILADWVAELRVPIVRGREVKRLSQDGDSVVVATTEGALRADYVVGCDGGRSVVRKAAGIEFVGSDATTSQIIAEVEMTEEPRAGLHRDAHGIHSMGRIPNGAVRVMVTEKQVGASEEPTLADLKVALVDAYGTDFGVHSPASISRFTDMARQAATYRAGRVLLAGDAAHVHYPTGGQGLNIGMQDAVNLGWKLAQVVKGSAPGRLLDTYGAERHPIAARVLRDTKAQVALLRGDERTDAAREIFAQLLAMDEPRKFGAGMMSGLDIRYDLGEGHPLLGRRMPDLDLITPAGPRRVYSFLHDARPALINFGTPSALDSSGWSERVPAVDATYEGRWELPVIGAVSAPGSVLVRPDGYVAWVGEGTNSGLSEALTAWFGPQRLG